MAITLCVVVAIVASVAVAAWVKRRNHPSAGSIQAFLSGQLSAMPVQILSVAEAEPSPTSTGMQFEFRAEARPVDDLFERVSTTQFFATHFASDVPEMEATRGLLDSALGQRLVAEAGLAAKPANPLDAVVLRVATSRTSSLTYVGILEAHRGADGWQFRLVDSRTASGSLVGSPRASFGANTYVESDPADVNALRGLLEQYNGAGQKLEAARVRVEAAAKAEREAREKAILAQFQPGTLFRGAAVRRNDQRSTPVFLEITEVRPESQEIAGIVRNDGGWGQGRRVAGTFRYDGQTFSIQFRSEADQAVESGGPVLQDEMYGGFQLPLVLDKDGALHGETNFYTFQFASVPANEVAAVKASVNAPVAAALAATAAGTVYHGAAVSKNSNASEPILVRFTAQENGGALLTAEIQSPDRPSLHRTLRGTVIGNTYRAAGSPIRLNLDSNDAVRSASDASVFGSNWVLTVALRPQEDQLIGEDNRFRYTLVRATPQYLADLENARKAKIQAFHAVVRPGAEYDGTIRDQQGFASRIRLRVVRQDTSDQTVVVVIESREQNGIYHEFSGAYDDVTGEIKLGSTGHGRFNPGGNLRVPFFSMDSTFQVALVVSGSAITGDLPGWQRWDINLPLGTSAADSHANVPAAVDPNTGLPAYPTASGAYVLGGNRWLPLPRNNGRVNASPLSAVTSTLAGINGVLGALTGNRTAASAAPTVVANGLVYDGVDPRPSVSGDRVILAYVGTVKAVSATLVERYPDLRTYPAIEVEMAERRSDGARLAPLEQIVPGVAGFGSKRLPAIVESPTPGVVAFTATGQLAAGTYAVGVGDQAFEFDVK